MLPPKSLLKFSLFNPSGLIPQTDEDDATSDLGLGGEGGGWRPPQTDADTDVNTEATSDVTYQKGKIG